MSELYKGHPDQRYGPTTYSQNGQDLMILNLFDLCGVPKPSYMDVGAHHPFNISNTALLYSRGCKGLNVEANPLLMDAFYSHRSEDNNLNVGIAPQQGKMTFYMWDDFSGRNTFSMEHSLKMEVLSKTRELPVTTMDEIINNYCNGLYPDFLNMDIEGLDFDVLKSCDFSKSSPKIICVEVLDNRIKFSDMMKSKNFLFYSRHGMDLIFVRDDLYPNTY